MKYLAYGVGVALIGVGLTGLTRDGIVIGWAVCFGAILFAHDALLMPAALLAGTVVGRWPPARRASVIVAALLTAATLPTVLALGRRPDNPSILPLDYPLNLALVLAALVLVAPARRLLVRTDRSA
ncbi:hypothetical protein ACIBEJ_05290 [Nonomuraea sp. NPDC050790]|uniref:hypothetical protein n=1 Tax=Nonomuraea sp. NPDC050790 TaxID=3364371 RepID=UPI00379CBACC